MAAEKPQSGGDELAALDRWPEALGNLHARIAGRLRRPEVRESLWRERPHELSGLQACLGARVALHNFCIWLNEQLGRPRLDFADLLGW